MTDFFCGTSGFSYAAWKGPFYPAKLPANRMLDYYSSRLTAVEINNTFYRLPQPRLIESWRSQVGESFRFAIKAPRRITHLKRLKDCAEEVSRLAEVVAGLSDHLGAVLVQLPPTFRLDRERLEAFLTLWPQHLPLAFEFRHDSWNDAGLLRTLGNHGAAWVNVDEGGALPAELPRTASWTYLRLRGSDYDDASLTGWQRLCSEFERAYVFFKHEDEGAGPAFAERMQQLA